MSKIWQSADLEVIARSEWRSFYRNENGAITTDFVVQAALVVSLGVILVTSIGSDASRLAGKTALAIRSSQGATEVSGGGSGSAADGSVPSANTDGQAHPANSEKK